jgi:hypothetical protein
MRKLIIIFFIICILFPLSGCGGGSSPSPTQNTYSVSVNTYDKNTSQQLNGVSLTILETGQSIKMGNSSYQTNLNAGQYTIYLLKSDYISKGYALNLTKDTVINVYLTPVDNVDNNENYGTVSGEVLDNSVNYTGTFNICTANQTTINDISNATSPFSNIISVCGNIAVSIYTTTINGIDKIAYLKTSLNPGGSQTGLVLTMPASPLNYSGTKPSGDTLVVKQSNGYILASQITNNNSYSFETVLQTGDSLTLESSRIVNDTSYFTRVAAGDAGGTVNLQYQSTVPSFTVTPSGSNYKIDFNPVDFASYYEVYAIQVIGGVAQVPFQAIGLSGTCINVPKSIFATGADITLINVRAINLNGFDSNNILTGTQSYPNYSYTEYTQTLNLDSSSLSLLSLNRNPNLSQVVAKTKIRFNLNYLCTEPKERN